MRKNNITVLLAMLLLFTSCSVPQSLSGTSNANASMYSEAVHGDENSVKSAPLLWKISDDDNTVYLMGTIHAGNTSTSDFEDYVEKAYKDCSAIAVECDTAAFEADTQRAAEASRMLLLNDGTTASEHIDKQVHSEIVDLLKKYNAYNEALEYYVPFMWINQISQLTMLNTDLNYDYGVDGYFLNRAKNSGKAVYEIESVEEQYEIFSLMSDAYSNLALKQVTEDGYIEKSAEELNELYKAWHDGDEKFLTGLLDEENDISDNPEDKKIIDEYNELLVYGRNKKMAQAAKEYLAGGENVLMLVGVLHYVGDNGIIDLLEKDGCHPESVK